MTSPGNGASVCGTQAEITFSGYALEPSTEVTIEAAVAPEGPFLGVTSFKARGESGAVTLKDGTKVYEWTGKARVPFASWGAAKDGTQSTYIRASQPFRGGGPYHAYTFEAGSPWLACVSEGLDAGKTANEAVVRCARPSPVARIDAPETSTCALRQWQIACPGARADASPMRYYVVPANVTSPPCRAPANLAGWTLSSLFGDEGPPVCVAEWTGGGRPGNTALNALEAFADPYRRIDKVDTVTGAPSMNRSISDKMPAIYADCPSPGGTCTTSPCRTVGTVVRGGEGKDLSDLSSGCPKCAATESGMIYAVVPPEWRSMPLSVSHPNGSGKVLRIDPQGEQVLVIPPPPGGLASFFDPGSAEDGATFTVTPACWYDARLEAKKPKAEQKQICNPDGSYKVPR